MNNMKNVPRFAVFTAFILLLFGLLFQTHLKQLETDGQYLQAHRWQPWRTDLLEKAATQALERSEPLTAIDLLLQVRQAGRLGNSGRRTLAQAYLQSGQTDLALSEWESLRASGEADAQSLLQMARIYHQRADFDLELQVSQQGATIDPSLAEFHWRLTLLAMTESPAESIPFLERLQALDPLPDYPLTSLRQALSLVLLQEEPAAQLTLSARTLASLSEWALALRAIEHAIQIDPAHAPAWALLAEARQQTGAPDALPALQRALQLDPNAASTHAYLGLYWQRQRDFANASQAFQRAAKLEPQNPIWLMNLSELALQTGDVPLAHAYSLQAVDLAPQNPLAWRALALFCLQTEGCLRQDGLPAALKARALAPEDWHNFEVLGRVHMALGESESAHSVLTQAVQMAPGEPSPRFYLGLLHLRAAEYSLARENLQTALDLDPQGPLSETIRSIMDRYLP